MGLFLTEGVHVRPMFANIWGEAGVDKMISILTTEIHTQMQLLGVKSLAEVDMTRVSRSTCFMHTTSLSGMN